MNFAFPLSAIDTAIGRHQIYPNGRNAGRKTSVVNSSAFYCRDAGTQDWTDPQNDLLWRDGIKTLFDPCPAGWRVPSGGEGEYSPWPERILTETTQITPYPGIAAGYYLNETVSFPTKSVLNVTGGRSCRTGMFINGGTRGWWWTGNVLEQSTRVVGRTLSIYSTKVINQSNPCGDCFSVRCVRE